MTHRLYAVDGADPADLERRTEEQIVRLEEGGYAPPGDLPHRRIVVADGPAEAARRLRRGRPVEVLTGQAEPGRPVVLMLSGVGDQYPGMAAGLYERFPVFRRELDHCLAILRDDTGIDLHAVLYPERPADGAPGLADLFDRRDGTREIHRTLIAQPLAFAVQYALARALLAAGVRPHALLGYSVGEYTAACLAGVLPLDGALRLVALRARLVDELPEGAMLAVLAPPGPLAAHLRGGVAVAALDGPELTVLAGPPAAIERAAEALTADGLACRRLATGHAFHSPLMDPVAEPLRAALAGIPLRAPSIPVGSNVTGTWLTGGQATDPAYWADHLRRPLRFADELAEVARLARPITVEVGPGRTLTGLAAHDGLKLRTLPGVYESRSDVEILLTTLGGLWACADVAPPAPEEAR